ncbi:heat shock protein Hsp20 [Calothrix sp. NIES-4071]|nr:heat shock protein Hsp20 [Calothrix sp. NIES-4071]BAZ59225.1 heat shock protein Hsp20 [Calothrix sp. NIES-4105]
MSLTRWNPWQEMNTLQRQMNRLFDEAITPSALFEREQFKAPAIEMSETAEALQLKLELPGMEAKDLDIQVTENSVYISGERKQESKTDENGATRTEFYYGKFQRMIPLHTRIQNTEVKAEYKDGILNLTLPKTQQEKNKVVKVSLDGQAQ